MEDKVFGFETTSKAQGLATVFDNPENSNEYILVMEHQLIADWKYDDYAKIFIPRKYSDLKTD